MEELSEKEIAELDKKRKSRGLLVAAVVCIGILLYCAGHPAAPDKFPSEAAKAKTSAVTATTSPASDLAQIPQSRKNAVALALEYVDEFPYSRASLRDKLMEDGVGFSDAKYAAYNVRADWKAHAVLRVKALTITYAMSRAKILEQLKLDEYTAEESEYAVDNCGEDWMDVAALHGMMLLAQKPYTRMQMIVKLTDDGFTQQEAEYGATANGLDLEAIPTQPEETQPPATIGQQNALRKAQSYLSHTAFSYKRLIEQLEFEGFTHDEAVYGVDNCGADWMEQAVKRAESYLSHTAFSYKRLIEQLEFEGFTHDEAVYGVDNCGADWMEQAVKCAERYLSHTAFSRVRLIEQLEFEGFTHEQAVYGVEQNGL